MPFVGALPEFFQSVPGPHWWRLFRLMGVRYFVIRTAMLRDPRVAAFADALEPVRPDAASSADPRFELAVFEDPGALPRALAVEHAECLRGDDEILARLTGGDFDPLRSVLLENGCAEEAPATPPLAHATRAVVVERDEPDLVQAVVELPRPGYLVLADTWDPGWRARVDGEPAEVLRANWVFRAVPVPAGRHVVELRYAPTSFRVGLVLAGLPLVLAAALGARRAVRRARADTNGQKEA
jgi:hypothetical protein